MSRLPIRVRLTLAFALAMAAVMAIVGGSLYMRLESSLDEEIDERLEGQVQNVDSSVWFGSTIGSLSEGVTQVYDQQGQLVAGDRVRIAKPLGQGHFIGLQTLITPAQLRAAADGPVRFELESVGGTDGPVRFLAGSAVTQELEPRVILVGLSLEDRDELLAGFLQELILVGLAALALVSVLGYVLATAALRPVESMRKEAAAITGQETGRRLPLPSSRDEVRRLGETLNEMLQRLDDAIERERTFVADASHELRTPIALLKTELDVALRRPRAVEEYERAVRSAAEEADRLVRLAEDLLVLARSDQGRLGLRPEPIAAEHLLGDVAQRFGDQVAVRRPSNGLTVLGDEVRLQQALGNLVDNALRHGGGSVTLSAIDEDGTVELHVRDEGPGFPEAFLPHAFERFSRPDEARSGGGTGLGLAIAQAIATAHGGSAGAANRSARGADVWLSIPA